LHRATLPPAPLPLVKLPNLLATKSGRLTAFFALYMTEGIPLGFTGTAIYTQMRRDGLETDVIGAFLASLYAPWGWKWIAGPFVDAFSSDRLGRRRLWIIVTQLLMTAVLLAAMPINFSTELKLFTIVIFIHNCFCATQDVAIDALACNTLTEQERGLANGLMFAGATVGSAIGGAGVLKMIAYTGWSGAYILV
jgi:PAT family beta-lactamase induction signal transducer AmpG